MSYQLKELVDILSSNENVTRREEAADELAYQLERARHYQLPIDAILLEKFFQEIKERILFEHDNDIITSLFLCLGHLIFLLRKCGKEPDLSWLEKRLASLEDESELILMVLRGSS